VLRVVSDGVVVLSGYRGRSRLTVIRSTTLTGIYTRDSTTLDTNGINEAKWWTQPRLPIRLRGLPDLFFVPSGLTLVRCVARLHFLYVTPQVYKRATIRPDPVTGLDGASRVSDDKRQTVSNVRVLIIYYASTRRVGFHFSRTATNAVNK
jgi:hypothetical protein